LVTRWRFGNVFPEIPPFLPFSKGGEPFEESVGGIFLIRKPEEVRGLAHG
jgi:hypothetical protein